MHQAQQDETYRDLGTDQPLLAQPKSKDTISNEDQQERELILTGKNRHTTQWKEKSIQGYRDKMSKAKIQIQLFDTKHI